MRKAHLLTALLILCGIATSFAGNGCGTIKLLEHLKSQNKTIKQLISQKPRARASVTTSTCTASDLYDSVYTRTTDHFEIFYTLDGPHQTTPEFVDSLSKSLEYAWNFHINKSGMLPPVGISESYHYQRATQNGYYTVEILDIDLLRDTRLILGGTCHGCYGLTIPFDSTQSELIIDNDFLYTPVYGTETDSVQFNGKTCSYSVATEPLVNTTYGYSYADRWNDALRITTAHELYHAIQFQYLSLDYLTFWFEASAAGIENVVVPDVNDYIAYVDAAARANGTPLDKIDDGYAASTFFLHLYHHVGQNTDRLVWENFKKSPSKTFQEQLSQVLEKKEIDADSVFHDFATRIAFAGNRSSLVDTAFWIDEDQPLWPDFTVTAQSGNFSVYPLASLGFQFYSNGEPDLSDFTGKASAVILKNHSYSVRFLPTTNSVDSVRTEYREQAGYDSTLWILSHFRESDVIPTLIQDSTLRAYPVPWREGHLCFTPLPQNKEFVEIRNRRGNLVKRIRYDSNTLCLEEDQVKSLMVPGVYRFRAGNHGKTKNFIVIY